MEGAIEACTEVDVNELRFPGFHKCAEDLSDDLSVEFAVSMANKPADTAIGFLTTGTLSHMHLQPQPEASSAAASSSRPVPAEEEEEKLEQRKPKKRKKESDVDVAQEFFARIPKIYELREVLDGLVAAERFVPEAQDKKAELLEELKHMEELSVCMSCWIEAPSAKARKFGAEWWHHVNHRMLCARCGRTATCNDGSQNSMKQACESLRRRVRAELEMALEHLPESCDSTMRKKLKAATRDLEVKFGVGKAPRQVETKKVQLAWLATQLHRTRERLLPEKWAVQERSALLLALEALELR